MKEIKRYLYYSPDVDVKYPDQSQFLVSNWKSEFLFYMTYIGDNYIENFKFYYIGEY